MIHLFDLRHRSLVFIQLDYEGLSSFVLWSHVLLFYFWEILGHRLIQLFELILLDICGEYHLEDQVLRFLELLWLRKLKKVLIKVEGLVQIDFIKNNRKSLWILFGNCTFREQCLSLHRRHENQFILLFNILQFCWRLFILRWLS